MKKFMPFFVDMSNKKVLVIGAGDVAYRKIKTLMLYDANIVVVSEEIKNKNIYNINKYYSKIKIYDKIKIENFSINNEYFLVIAATDDIILNEKIYKICKHNKILVNNASSKNKLDIRMASIYENEDFQIAVSCYGYPKKSKEIRDKIKKILNINGGKNMKKIINTKNAPAAIGPYSQAIEVNGTLYVSGQIPFVPETMTLVSEDVSEQTRQSLKNISAILDEAGYSFKDVVKATVFIKSMDDFAKINSVYEEYLGQVNPARACVEVSKLPKDVKVEIEVIAVK